MECCKPLSRPRALASILGNCFAPAGYGKILSHRGSRLEWVVVEVVDEATPGRRRYFAVLYTRSYKCGALPFTMACAGASSEWAFWRQSH